MAINKTLPARIIIWRDETLKLLDLDPKYAYEPIEAYRGTTKRNAHRWYFTIDGFEYSVDEGSIIPFHPTEYKTITVLTRRHVGNLIRAHEVSREFLYIMRDRLQISFPTLRKWEASDKVMWASEVSKEHW